MEGTQYSDKRVECKTCGRTFAPEVLPRHTNICKKNEQAMAKRKVFDSSKQRTVEGLSYKQIKTAQKKETKQPKNHWREQHQDFINAIRSAKGVQHALDTGGPLPPPPPPSINADYIQCPHCSRRFNEKAAARHINFCKEQQMRLPKGKTNTAAAAKQNARLTYQAPKPKTTTPSSGGSSVTTRNSTTSTRGAAPIRGRAPVAAGRGSRRF